MALGDLLARFSKSSPVSMSNHLDELSGIEDESATTSMVYLPQTVVLCESRHEGFEDRVPSGLAKSGTVAKWRCMEVPLKTEFVVLVLCINISDDPSDVIKTSPCARMECWIDPFSMAPREAFETIGGALCAQYQRWLPHAHYNMVRCHPTVEELQSLCTNSRKHAQSHRVLFHYNGHDVPNPSANGQIWVYDKTKTQHIPLSFTDLDSWLGTPSVYVFDCSAAGMIVNSFVQHQDWSSSGTLSGSSMDCILFAACEAHETLPQSAEFPTDFFTSCLTTPIKMALWWLCSRSLLRDSLDKSFIDQIPGRSNDRKTLLGELHWIFTAVTDTIAWNILPPELFQRLFRRDKLVASLFRNFLLADRIMRAANCSPVSYPVLPTAHQHYLWDAWDMAAEICLSKLPLIADDPNAEFQPSPFFTEQLMAFEVWLDHGSEHKKPPKQLPIVLQVLLSVPLRFRALVLLGRFVDMGSWAVELALSVGILTYILKLLSSAAIEVRQTLVFIWTKIFALDKSCQVDMVMNGGHVFIIKFLDSMEAFPEQRAMAAFVLAVVVDGYRRGQVACIQASLIHVCLRHLRLASPHDAQTEPLLLQWLCLCLGKSWENFPVAQAIGLQLDALATCASLLSEPQPEVRAAAVFALGTLLDVDGHGGDDGRDDDEKTKSDLNIITCILQVVGDGSPMVRAEVAVALGRFAFSHNRHLKSIAFACLKPQSNSKLNLLASLANISSPSGYANPSHHYMQPTSVPSSQFCTILRSSDRDGRISTSCPLTSSGVMHGSPLSDDSSEHSGSGIMLNRSTSTGVMYYSRPRPIDSATYSQCVLAMSTLAKDPSPRIASLGRRTLSIIGIERVVSKTAKLCEQSIHQLDFSTSSRPSVAGLTRSSSLFDMNAGHLLMTFGPPPVSPPRRNFVAGLRRVYSLELQPRHMNFPDPGLADPGLSFSGSTGVLERSLLPQSTIYNWSCGHFSRPLLTEADDREEMIARREDRERTALDHLAKCQRSSVRKLNNPIAFWDTKFETGMKATLLLPFSPVVVAADENEIIRVWNYEEPTAFTPMNSFNNHDLSDSGISKLCLMNELDDSLLLVASCDGNVRIWKDYTVKGKQKLVTAFSAIQGQRPGFCTSAIVDWQHLSGYLYASSGSSPILLWDLDKEQHASSISSSSDSSISVMSCSQVQGGQLAAGFMDGSVKIFDIHTPDMPVCSMRPHTQTVERVVGIGFQPGLDSSKIVSASQAGDIQFLDIRNPSKAYLTINAHRGSLTALAIHRHAPVIASGSSQQIVKVFSLYGDQLSAIKYHSTFMAQRIGSVSCLAFHPYKVVLAAGDADAFVSVYADDC